MKAKEIDRKFDEVEDISKYLDMAKARRPEQEQKRVFDLLYIQRIIKTVFGKGTSFKGSLHV